MKQSNPADSLKDTMWFFLQNGGQKENIPALKGYVYDLIQAVVQKDAGQRGKSGNIDWKELEMIMFSIVCEAVALVLSGKLEMIEERDEDTD